MDASHQNERSMQWSGGHQESLVDQRLRVWRSVASFLWTLEGYVTKCPSNRQDLHTQLSQHFKHFVGACDQHVRDEETHNLIRSVL